MKLGDKTRHTNKRLSYSCKFESYVRSADLSTAGLGAHIEIYSFFAASCYCFRFVILIEN